ncbi:sulfurtransferase [uncultured Roseobacter sp.]|uniref:sulfurtransferase n=1 Tax=uncultured Roseobacter sp. TaxID=114847 RepID=UPI00263586C9|nr:sulfurtransferase [uncultured Roseobacter sp.]
MTMKLTRRRLGGLMLAATALPRLAVANVTDYAHPDLLIRAADLDAKVWMEGDEPAVLVDVRNAKKYAAGHIPGAILLDANAVVAQGGPVKGALRPQAEIEALLGENGLLPSRHIILYDDRGGFHAARMFWLLEYLGHQKVTLLNGGLKAWIANGGKLASRKSDPKPGRFVSALMPRRFASADYIMAHRRDRDTIVIDVRPPKTFAKGHIPWAKNVPWSANLDAEGLFLSAHALQAHFAGHGVTPDKNIVIHCEVGLASSHSYVALRLLGYPRVRVYHRSWAEWGQDPSLPRAGGV